MYDLFHIWHPYRLNDWKVFRHGCKIRLVLVSKRKKRKGCSMTKKTEAAYDSTKKVIWQSIKDLSNEEIITLAEELIAELEGILDNAKRELKELNR